MTTPFIYHNPSTNHQISGLTVGSKYLIIALATYDEGGYAHLSYNNANTESVYKVYNYAGTGYYHSFCFAIVKPTSTTMTFSGISDTFSLTAWVYDI